MVVNDADLVMVSGDNDHIIDLNSEIDKFEKEKRIKSLNDFMS